MGGTIRPKRRIGPERHHGPSTAGFGTIFFIAIGTIVILALMVGANQFLSLSSQTRETSSAVELGRKATFVVESAIDEGVYHAVKDDLNNPAATDGLFKVIRQFAPLPGNYKPNAMPPIDGADPYLYTKNYAPALTYGEYTNDADIRLKETDPSKAPVYYGIVEQSSFPGDAPDANDSYGLLGFTHSTSLLASGHFRDIDRSGELLKTYRSILCAAPWPSCKYALVVLNDQTHAYNKNAFRNRFLEYKKLSDNLGPALAAAAGILGAGFSLPPFPLPDPTAPFAVSKDSVNPEDVAFKALADNSKIGTWDPQALVGFEQGTTPGSPAGSVTNLLAQIKAEYDRLVAAMPAPLSDTDRQALQQVMMRDQGDWMASWKNKATIFCTDIADLAKISKGGVLVLNGVYYVSKEITLDHTFTGQGIIICGCEGDPSAKLHIKRFQKDASAGPDDRALLVSLQDIDVSPMQFPGQIDADLVAANGTLTGVPLLDVTPGAVTPIQAALTINGTLVVDYIDNPTGDLAAVGPTINCPAAGRFSAWKPGQDFAVSSQKQMRVFVDPGYVKRRYWSRRDH